jgi:hypothetical protein
LNEALLEAQGREKESQLGAMMKQLSWAQQRLAEKISFPVVGNFAEPEMFLQQVKADKSEMMRDEENV